MNRRFSNYLELTFYKAYADLKAEASRGYLGTLWWILEPVLYLAVFYVVFSVIRYQEGGDFVTFMLVGLVAWKWFASTVAQGARSISNGVGLMQQVYLPKFIFPGVVALTNFVKFAVVVSILMGFLILYGVQPTLQWLWLPAIIVVQFVLGLAIASMLAAILPFLPDLRQLIDNALVLLFFLSGVIFDISRAPPQIETYLYLNPMVALIESYREVLLEGRAPQWLHLLVILAVSLSGIVAAMLLLKRFDRVYPKVVVR